MRFALFAVLALLPCIAFGGLLGFLRGLRKVDDETTLMNKSFDAVEKLLGGTPRTPMNWFRARTPNTYVVSFSGYSFTVKVQSDGTFVATQDGGSRSLANYEDEATQKKKSLEAVVKMLGYTPTFMNWNHGHQPDTYLVQANDKVNTMSSTVYVVKRQGGFYTAIDSRNHNHEDEATQKKKSLEAVVKMLGYTPTFMNWNYGRQPNTYLVQANDKVNTMSSTVFVVKRIAPGSYTAIDSRDHSYEDEATQKKKSLEALVKMLGYTPSFMNWNYGSRPNTYLVQANDKVNTHSSKVYVVKRISPGNYVASRD